METSGQTREQLGACTWHRCWAVVRAQTTVTVGAGEEQRGGRVIPRSQLEENVMADSKPLLDCGALGRVPDTTDRYELIRRPDRTRQPTRKIKGSSRPGGICPCLVSVSPKDRGRRSWTPLDFL